MNGECIDHAGNRQGDDTNAKWPTTKLDTQHALNWKQYSMDGNGGPMPFELCVRQWAKWYGTDKKAQVKCRISSSTENDNSNNNNIRKMLTLDYSWKRFFCCWNLCVGLCLYMEYAYICRERVALFHIRHMANTACSPFKRLVPRHPWPINFARGSMFHFHIASRISSAYIQVQVLCELWISSGLSSLPYNLVAGHTGEHLSVVCEFWIQSSLI